MLNVEELPQQSLERPDLQNLIPTALLADDPDPKGLLKYFVEEKGLEPGVAEHVRYQVVARINAALFPPITKMELIHTEGCNLACAYCFEKDMLGYRRMPTDVGRRAVDLLLDYAGNRQEVTITHFGGEPTVNFRAVRDITEYAKQQAELQNKTVTFSMTSNGVLIDDGKAKYCAEHKIMVLLSIDGMRKSHDRYRVDKRGRGTFDQALSALRKLKRTQQWVGVKMTVMPSNAANLYDDVIGLYELGVNQFVIGYATGIKWPEFDMETFVEQWSKVYQWYQGRSHDDLRMTEFDDLDQEYKANFGCQAGNDTITVSVSGEISPCSKILALDNKKLMLKLGDVHSGLTHLRNRLELTRGTGLIAACKEEGIFESYQGGCWATNYSDNRDLLQPSMQDQAFKIRQKAACAGCSACK